MYSLSSSISSVYFFLLSSFISYTCSVFFFYSFHLDAPTTSPTPTTNPVNTQGTVRPHLPSLSAMCVCVCVRVRVYQGKEEQGRVPEAKWDRGTASSNQIVLLIGDTATGGAGMSETPVIVSSSQTSDLKGERKRTRWAFFSPGYLIGICSDISSRHVRHFTTPFPSTHKCHSHLAGFKAEGDQYLFSQRQWELKARAAVRL